jgi:hypothetical protein
MRAAGAAYANMQAVSSCSRLAHPAAVAHPPNVPSRMCPPDPSPGCCWPCPGHLRACRAPHASPGNQGAAPWQQKKTSGLRGAARDCCCKAACTQVYSRYGWWMAVGLAHATECMPRRSLAQELEQHCPRRWLGQWLALLLLLCIAACGRIPCIVEANELVHYVQTGSVPRDELLRQRSQINSHRARTSALTHLRSELATEPVSMSIRLCDQTQKTATQAAHSSLCRFCLPVLLSGTAANVQRGDCKE